MSEKRSVLEVFVDHKVTTHIPIEYLIEGIGKQRPREFSISSTSSQQSTVDLTVAMTEYQTKGQK